MYICIYIGGQGFWGLRIARSQKLGAQADYDFILAGVLYI